MAEMMQVCPKCEEPALKMEGGCNFCMACGFGKCDV